MKYIVGLDGNERTDGFHEIVDINGNEVEVIKEGKKKRIKL